MRQITTIAFLFLALTLNIRSVSAQINPSIGTSGGVCWDDNAGTVTCKDVTTNTSLGSYTYGLGNSGLVNYGSYLALGSDDTVDTVQLRNMNDNATCVVQGHGFGLGGSATHVYVTNYFQDKLVKIENDLSAGSCSAATDVPLLGHSPRKIIVIGSKLYVLMDGTAVMNPSIDEIDMANGDSVVSHPLGAMDSDDLQDMTYDPGTDSFIVSYDSGLWSVSRSTWNKTSWGDVTGAMAGLDYLDGYMVGGSYAGSYGYIFDPGNPNNEIPVNLTFAIGGILGYSSIGLTAFFMDGTGLRAFDLSGVEQAFSPITTDFGGMVYVKPWNTPAVCNNGVQEGTEECDGTDFGGQTCQGLGFAGGSLACDNSCNLVLTGCLSQVCQNGTQEGSEDCDGSDFGSATCQSEGFMGGTLNCTSSCEFDTSSCNMCGNNSVDSGEECDGGDFNSHTCQTQGFDGGSLACNSSCEFDTSSCITATCGNNTIEGNEDCDGNNNLGGATCASLGFVGGTLACQPGSCAFDTSGCTMCGNNTIDGTEVCDGINLNGESCSTQGFDGGTLACNSGCSSFNTSSCTLSTCGDGVIDSGEACDDGNLTNSDGCSSNCQVEDGYECYGQPSNCMLMCGNEAIDDGEECDGQDFGTASCSDFGFDSGALSCTSSCTIDTSSCLACNQDGLVQELGSGDFDASSQLQGELMTKYTEVTSSLQSQALEASCEQEVEIFGASVPGIVVSVNDQHYVHFRVKTADFVVDRLFFSYFGAAELAISTDNPLEQEIYGDGDVIFIHSGENITVKRGWNATGTVGTIAGIFTATYNRRQEVDGWFWEIVPQTDMVKPFEFGNDLNSIIIGTDDSGLPYYIDKDAAHDLSEIGRRPGGGGGGGCNQANCSQSNGATSLGVMFGILMLWLLLGLRRHRRAPSRIKENDRKSR